MKVTLEVFDGRGKSVSFREEEGFILSNLVRKVLDKAVDDIDYLPVEGPESWDTVNIHVHR